MSDQREPQRQLQISMPEVKQEQEQEGPEDFFTPTQTPSASFSDQTPTFGDIIAGESEGLAQMFQPSQLYHTGDLSFQRVFDFRDVKQEPRGSGQASSHAPPIVDFHRNNPLSQLVQPITPAHINPLELFGTLGHDYLGERDRAGLSGEDPTILIAQHTGISVDECRARVRIYEEYHKLIAALKEFPVSTQEEVLADVEKLTIGYSLKYGLLGEVSTSRPATQL